MNERYKTFLLPANKSGMGACPIEKLPARIDQPERLGIMTFRLKHDPYYALTVIDIKEKYAPLCIELLEGQVERGEGMHLYDYMTEFMKPLRKD
jgi:hypothetical protein